MIPLFDRRSAIHDVRKCLTQALSWRRRRNLSMAVNTVLRPVVGHEKAAQIASEMTDVPPHPWLTASEAQEDLARRGIKFGVRKLQRLAVRAAGSKRGQLSFWVNASGEWDNENSPELVDPKIAIVAKIDGRAARFLVCQLSQNIPYHDT
jgi:hypothetical protein